VAEASCLSSGLVCFRLTGQCGCLCSPLLLSSRRSLLFVRIVLGSLSVCICGVFLLWLEASVVPLSFCYVWVALFLLLLPAEELISVFAPPLEFFSNAGLKKPKLLRRGLRAL